MDIDIDVDQFDGLVEGSTPRNSRCAAAAGRLEAIHALHQALPTDRYSAACDALVAEVACSSEPVAPFGVATVRRGVHDLPTPRAPHRPAHRDIDLDPGETDRHLAAHQRPG